ncbi:MAG: LysM peptidoglycan-binding domain-containing protein [Verrucomicrobia bacterium]|nr:LysM peptidoglycan-binding domain-containing protein [Verrucomicrobiota bacterium]
MKSLNPFNAPRSPQAEQQRMRQERFKVVMWTVVLANMLLLVGLLIQGCQQEPAVNESPGGSAAEMTSPDTNRAAMSQPAPDTNAPVAPSFAAPMTNAAPEPAVGSAAPEQVQAGSKPYVVAKGDSFYKIAKANGVSMKALAAANPGVNSAKLKVGQKLQLPAGAPPATASVASAPAHTSAKAEWRVVKPFDFWWFCESAGGLSSGCGAGSSTGNACGGV